MPAEKQGTGRGGRGIVRGAMLVAWCLVLWGNLILLATLVVLVTRGGAAALALFARQSPVNQVLGAVALLVWGLAAWALFDARRTRPSTSA